MNKNDQQLLEETYIEVLNEFNFSKLNPFKKTQANPQQANPQQANPQQGTKESFALVFDLVSSDITKKFKEHQIDTNDPLFVSFWKTLMQWRSDNLQ